MAYPFHCHRPIIVKRIVIDAGLRESLGTMMKLSLLMWQRNHLPPSLHLVVWAIRKVVALIRTWEAGKDKGTGRRTGAKPMLEKGSLHFLSSILLGPVLQSGILSEYRHSFVGDKLILNPSFL